MGKAVEKKESLKRKKKGKPSLIDLHKRSLKNGKPNSTLKPAQNTLSTLRRSTRRNPIPSDEDDDEDEEEELPGVKNLKVVLKSNSVGREESNTETCTVKKRKINDGTHGSEGFEAVKDEMSNSGVDCQQGNQIESGPSTPLPDKALLLIILQRLQKLDKYGVFSEPVDPEELPDYHDIIEHPMDFATVRKKLDSGAYANLEQFEKDVFLISSNAMQYNASDTIYFRQARSIQDLAKKSFENLTQDSDDNEADRKTARRGRPPTYCVKKTPIKPVMEHLISEANSKTVFTAGGSSRTLFNNDMRKGYPWDKTCNNEGYRGCTTENKWDRTDGVSGSLWKSRSEKYGKNQLYSDEDWRNTYLHPHPYTRRPDSTVLTTLGGERKQLVAVGHFSGHGYARSLALFAANFGPAAWKDASKKIERSLAAGVRFGPGWVGDNDVVQQRPSVLVGQLTGWLSPLKQFPVARSSSPVAETSSVERKEEPAEKPDHNSSGMSKKSQTDKLSGKEMPSTETLDNNSSTCDSHSAIPSSSLAGTNGALESTTLKVEAAELKTPSPFNSVNGSVSTKKPNSSYQTHESSSSHPHLNGINGFNLPPRIDKIIGVSMPFETSRTLGGSPKTNVHSAVVNTSNHEDTRSSDISRFQSDTQNLANRISGFCPNASSENMSEQSSDLGLQPRAQNSIPPDLNIGFQSPGSPSSCKVDSVHPDLALQL